MAQLRTVCLANAFWASKKSLAESLAVEIQFLSKCNFMHHYINLWYFFLLADSSQVCYQASILHPPCHYYLMFCSLCIYAGSWWLLSSLIQSSPAHTISIQPLLWKRTHPTQQIAEYERGTLTMSLSTLF